MWRLPGPEAGYSQPIPGNRLVGKRRAALVLLRCDLQVLPGLYLKNIGPAYLQLLGQISHLEGEGSALEQGDHRHPGRIAVQHIVWNQVPHPGRKGPPDEGGAPFADEAISRYGLRIAGFRAAREDEFGLDSSRIVFEKRD